MSVIPGPAAWWSSARAAAPILAARPSWRRSSPPGCPKPESRCAALSRRSTLATLTGDFDPETLLKEPEFVAPLRKHDCAPVTDGAAALVLAAGDRAGEVAVEEGGAADDETVGDLRQVGG